VLIQLNLAVIGHFVSQGGKVWELIEPFDGFRILI